MIDKKVNCIILLGGVINVVCNVFYDIWQIPGIWYYGNAFAFVCYSYALNKIIKSTVTMLIFALCFSQLIDEILGTPTRIEAIEYLSFVLIIIYLKLIKR